MKPIELEKFLRVRIEELGRRKTKALSGECFYLGDSYIKEIDNRLDTNLALYKYLFGEFGYEEQFFQRGC